MMPEFEIATRVGLATLWMLALGACSSDDVLPASQAAIDPPAESVLEGSYRIGPGDSLRIFVWRNPEISTQVQVRPDGMISTPLVEDMVAIDKTPTQLARDMEEVLATYIKSPSVNVIVSGFVGTPADQIRVVGQAANPQAISYREGMTILDLIIAVGGLGNFAAGNRAILIRKIDGESVEFRVRLDDLINKGDIEQNIEVQPGDILIIPEAYF